MQTVLKHRLTPVQVRALLDQAKRTGIENTASFFQIEPEFIVQLRAQPESSWATRGAIYTEPWHMPDHESEEEFIVRTLESWPTPTGKRGKPIKCPPALQAVIDARKERERLEKQTVTGS